MDMYQMNTEINHRRDALMQEAQRERLSRIARQAKTASTPSLVQRVSSTLANVRFSAAPEPCDAVNPASVNI